MSRSPGSRRDVIDFYFPRNISKGSTKELSFVRGVVAKKREKFPLEWNVRRVADARWKTICMQSAREREKLLRSCGRLVASRREFRPLPLPEFRGGRK